MMMTKVSRDIQLGAISLDVCGKGNVLFVGSK